MRGCERNKRKLWYSLYLGKQPVIDEGGKKTGEYNLSFSNPVQLYANYSAGTDTLTIGEYGIQEKYDRMLVVFDKDCPIAEDTRIWINQDPVTIEDGEPVYHPHNYVVSAKQDGLNNIRYGLMKVKVS